MYVYIHCRFVLSHVDHGCHVHLFFVSPLVNLQIVKGKYTIIIKQHKMLTACKLLLDTDILTDVYIKIDLSESIFDFEASFRVRLAHFIRPMVVLRGHVTAKTVGSREKSEAIKIKVRKPARNELLRSTTN